MKIVQRISEKCKGEYLEQLIDCAKKYPNSVTGVWLSTKYGFPSLEVHKEYAKCLSQTAMRLREEGISVDLQLSNSIGHGAYMACVDCSGLVYEGSPVRQLVGHDGSVAEFCFCWNDETFRQYNKELIKYYISEIKPGEFWIDDDLRATNHDPVNFGCFCENCIAKFNKKHRYTFDRESLINEFLHGNINVRAQYIEQIRSDIASFTHELCQVVAKYSPDTVVSLQNGPNGHYTGYGYGHILDAMYNATGHAPNYRPGAGAYQDHNPNEIIFKAYNLSRQCEMLPDYVKGLYPEIESIPHNAMGKTMAGVAFESTVYLASGMTDLSYAMLGDFYEPFSFFEEGFKLFSEHNAYWEKLSEISKNSKAAGICYAESKAIHLRKLAQSDDMYSFNEEYYRGADMLIRNGIPLTYRNSNT